MGDSCTRPRTLGWILLVLATTLVLTWATRSSPVSPEGLLPEVEPIPRTADGRLVAGWVPGARLASPCSDGAVDLVVPCILCLPFAKERVASYRQHVKPRPRRIFFVPASSHACEPLLALGNDVFCLPMHAASQWDPTDMKAARPDLDRYASLRILREIASLLMALPDVGLSQTFVVLQEDVLFVRDTELLVGSQNGALGAGCQIAVPPQGETPKLGGARDTLLGPAFQASGVEPARGLRWMVFHRNDLRPMMYEIFHALHVGEEPASVFYERIVKLGDAFRALDIYFAWLTQRHPERLAVPSGSGILGQALDVEGCPALTKQQLAGGSIADESFVLVGGADRFATGLGACEAHSTGDGFGAVLKEWRHAFPTPAADPSSKQFTVAVWHKVHRPPWGGANQFVMAVSVAMHHLGIRIVNNVLAEEVDAVFMNAHSFDHGGFRKAWLALPEASRTRIRVLHRLDGPHIFNRADSPRYRAMDTTVQQLNAKYATVTVHQSYFSMAAWEHGYRGHTLKPRVLIRNAPDAGIFYPSETEPRPRKPHSPFRIASSSHAQGVIKGSDTMRNLSRLCDAGTIHITYVGNNPGLKTDPCVTLVPPGTSEVVADTLREQDIFIQPSRQEPASNSLIEAMAVGLPILFRDEGGHPEEAGFGGSAFTTDEQLAPLIDDLVANYDFYAQLVGMPWHRDIFGIASHYIDVLQGREPGTGVQDPELLLRLRQRRNVNETELYESLFNFVD